MTQLRKGMPASRRTALKLLGGAAAASAFGARVSAADPIKIGLSAAFSGPNAAAANSTLSSATTSTSSIAASHRPVS